MKKYFYNLTKTAVQVYRFRAQDAAYWADVTIDTAPGAKYGRISIASDFGNWQNYWGACGEPFKQFLAGLDIHYAAGKFGADNFFNLNKTIQAIEETAKDHRFDTSSDKNKVMREIDDLRSCSNNKEEFTHIVFSNCPNIMRMYDTGPEIVTEVDPGFKNFWEQIWPNLLAEFKKEETAPENLLTLDGFAAFLDSERNKAGEFTMWRDLNIWSKETAFQIMLTSFKELNSIPPMAGPLTPEYINDDANSDKIFAIGITHIPALHKEPIKWIGKIGSGGDWAIYYHKANNDMHFIKRDGMKVRDAVNIRNLVPCTDEALKLYRH